MVEKEEKFHMSIYHLVKAFIILSIFLVVVWLSNLIEWMVLALLLYLMTMVKIFYIFISFLEPISLSFGAPFEIYLPRESSKIIVKASEHRVVI